MASIVVIEDESSVREVVHDLLSIEGHTVTIARNGREGLEQISRIHPDLIISDIGMPEMDGYAVLKNLRADPDLQATLFIILTARDDRTSIRQAMEMGADDYLSKPFHSHELIAAVNAQLSKRRVIEDKHETALRMLRRNIVYALPHELRTPLTLIMGNAELLADGVDDLDPGEVQDMVRTICRASHRLYNLFENYLIYAQIELISSDPQQRQALRNHIIRDSAVVIEDTATQAAADANRTADLSITALPIALQMAEDNLRKIIKELVSNACKFSPAGTPVVVETSRQQDSFVLQVSDRGRGMTRKQIDQIGAYMQFDRTVYEQQGLGMGLIIARRLVELHNGTLQIASSSTQGTRVRIELPLYG